MLYFNFLLYFILFWWYGYFCFTFYSYCLVLLDRSLNSPSTLWEDLKKNLINATMYHYVAAILLELALNANQPIDQSIKSMDRCTEIEITYTNTNN